MSDNKQMTIAEFVMAHGLTMNSVKVPNNPHMENSRKMDNYYCTLEKNLRPSPTMHVYYSKGVGHKGKRPTIEEVLDCLVLDSDAVGYNFEDWADNFGLDRDSRKAEKTYNICVEQGREFISFLGRKCYNELIESVNVCSIIINPITFHNTGGLSYDLS
jgi:hypothetical protein